MSAMRIAARGATLWRHVRPVGIRTIHQYTTRPSLLVHLSQASGRGSSLTPPTQWSSLLKRDDLGFGWQFTRGFAASGEVTIETPAMGESITEGSIADILKKEGESVQADEVIAQIETDKVTIDVRAPEAGVIVSWAVKPNDNVTVGQKLATLGPAGAKPAKAAEEQPVEKDKKKPKEEKPKEEKPKVEVKEEKPKEQKPAAAAPKESAKPQTSPPSPPPSSPATSGPRERRVPMSRLRKRVAQRLKDAQNTFALLTTFNEIDMTNLMSLRNDYKDAFLKKHGVKLGFMSAFVKASVDALKLEPAVNAVIDGEELVYRDYYDVSIAVGTPKGLVVPVLRNVDRMSFADVEKTINQLGEKARTGAIAVEDMAGGTFTISNGGVYGSLLSTPIINPPQSAILGMHAIQNRPMFINGQIVPRPMMYVALTYDHRLIDGREAVTFLKRIKEVVEDPRRLLLDV
eukprot:jgi/Chlat1/6492/Chrsp45S05982